MKKSGEKRIEQAATVTAPASSIEASLLQCKSPQHLLGSEMGPVEKISNAHITDRSVKKHMSGCQTLAQQFWA